MIRRFPYIVLPLFVLAKVCCLVPAGAQANEIIDLGTPGGTEESSQATAVSDTGFVIGTSGDSVFLWSEASGMQRLDQSGSYYASNVSNDGTVLLYSGISKDRVFTQFSDPSSGNALYGMTMDDNARVFGWYRDNSSGYAERNFVWENGSWRTVAFGENQAELQYPLAMNTAGQLIDQSSLSYFSIVDGSATPLPAPPFDISPIGLTDLANNSDSAGIGVRGNIAQLFFYNPATGFEGPIDLNAASATAKLNNSRVVVGYRDTFTRKRLAYLYHPLLGVRNLEDFLPSGSGWHLRYAADISNGDLIVGSGLHNGKERAFLLRLDNLDVPAGPGELSIADHIALGNSGTCQIDRGIVLGGSCYFEFEILNALGESLGPWPYDLQRSDSAAGPWNEAASGFSHYMVQGDPVNEPDSQIVQNPGFYRVRTWSNPDQTGTEIFSPVFGVPLISERSLSAAQVYLSTCADNNYYPGYPPVYKNQICSFNISITTAHNTALPRWKFKVEYSKYPNKKFRTLFSTKTDGPASKTLQFILRDSRYYRIVTRMRRNGAKGPKIYSQTKFIAPQ